MPKFKEGDILKIEISDNLYIIQILKVYEAFSERFPSKKDWYYSFKATDGSCGHILCNNIDDVSLLLEDQELVEVLYF